MTIKIEREAILRVAGSAYETTLSHPPPSSLDPCRCESESQSKPRRFRKRKCVSFADAMVSAVRTRPRTLEKERAALFYTADETSAFREEYRRERRAEALSRSGLDSLDARGSSSGPGSTLKREREGTMAGAGGARRRRRISRVVVQHQGLFSMFSDNDAACSTKSGAFFDNDDFW
eukprot:CAMPEP_0183307508 /NCGR_PEP_ID=MMETSP0160_2-20130417/17703_1 /TAXON_ID=2839 ORGANISM="Odontella Sinensis, Strain Grunow 1884" /NCGR_SAMPLE_ID=MMETSP0160_2 /ASSEMBLY_ACC=CAM_ASM_000250 /LENGTH=175 /DNA_ID=CAMNT_0025471105 /DNA_START=24 /DNA_END=548 /DNA_ORIENTATION=-